MDLTLIPRPRHMIEAQFQKATDVREAQLMGAKFKVIKLKSIQIYRSMYVHALMHTIMHA